MTDESGTSFCRLPEQTPEVIKAESLRNIHMYPPEEMNALFGPDSCCLPRSYADFYHTIRTTPVRQDDLWILTFPKSGTTWTMEMVYLLRNGLNYDAAKSPIFSRIPYFEIDAVVKAYRDKVSPLTERPSSMEQTAQLPSPRTILSHLPLNMLPSELTSASGPKIIYVARNPKDLCVSFYHHYVLLLGYGGTLDDFVEQFTNDFVLYAPYWTHLRKFWDRRNDPNVLFLKYEEMKKDLEATVQRVARFLGVNVDKADMPKLLHHLSFQEMKGNEHVNHSDTAKALFEIHGVAKRTDFIRKGHVGSWREELSLESNERLNEWIRKNGIQGIWADDVMDIPLTEA